MTTQKECSVRLLIVEGNHRIKLDMHCQLAPGHGGAHVGRFSGEFRSEVQGYDSCEECGSERRPSILGLGHPGHVRIVWDDVRAAPNADPRKGCRDFAHVGPTVSVPDDKGEYTRTRCSNCGEVV